MSSLDPMGRKHRADSHLPCLETQVINFPGNAVAGTQRLI